MATTKQYNPQTVDENILSRLNVDQAGDVVSAETWKALWELVLKLLAKYNTHFIEVYESLAALDATIERVDFLEGEYQRFVACVDSLEENWAAVQTARKEVDEDHMAVRDIKQVLEKSFIHYGELPPASKLIKMWVKPIGSVPSYVVMTEPMVSNYVQQWLDRHPDIISALKEKEIRSKHFSDEAKAWLRSDVINVKDFGATGNGETDDTPYIVEAFKHVTDNCKVIFPKGHYVLKSPPEGFYGGPRPTDPGHFFRVVEKKNVVIDLDGSTVALKIPNFNATRYVLFTFEDCENFTIKNGTLTGDASTHSYEPWYLSDGSLWNATHEFGVGVSVKHVKYEAGRDNAHAYYADPTQHAPYDYSKKCNGTICDLEIHNMTGDGISINNGLCPTNLVRVVNCDIHHCRRQGITIGFSGDTIIDDCHIHHIGCHIYDIQGNPIYAANPQAGIDIEAESCTFSVGKITIRNTIIENTTGFCIVCSPNHKYQEGHNNEAAFKTGVSFITEEIRIENCRLHGTPCFAGCTTRGAEIMDKNNYTPVLIKNSVLDHALAEGYPNNSKPWEGAALTVKTNTVSLNNTEMYNSVFNASDENVYLEALDHVLFGISSNKRILFDNCILNLKYATAKLRNSILRNSVINGGTVQWYGQAATHFGDCYNTVFNGCQWYVQAVANYATPTRIANIINCVFKDCQLVEGFKADGTPITEASGLPLINCYLDSKVFQNADYINCTIKGESVPQTTKDYVDTVIGGIENGSY